MSKINPLAGLIGHYDYSDEDSDEDSFSKSNAGKVDVSKVTSHAFVSHEVESSTIHPAPIPHCAWSACYDESSGFTYFWNQHTNAVTWEAPPEYLLALKLAQQQIHSSGTTEVSAAEWQLYQQALLEKQNAQNKISHRNSSSNSTSTVEKPGSISGRKPTSTGVKRAVSESDEEKIELITSYYNSDSESNDETETPKKTPQKSMIKPNSSLKIEISKPSQKKQKTKSEPIEYGPVLPPNYKAPIGAEPSSDKAPGGSVKDNSHKENDNLSASEVKTSSNTIELPENEDAQDDEVLFEKLKDKAELLKKLGGELPNELKNLIKDNKQPGSMSPDITTKVADDTSRDSKSTIDTNIDDLLEEIEKKEMPKIQSKDKVKIDIFGEDVNCESKSNSRRGSSEEEKNESNSQAIKPLFPSSTNINEEAVPKALFPSSANIEENGAIDSQNKTDLIKSVIEEKKGANLYIMDSNEVVDNTIRKKLRISSSVLPEKKKSEVPTYTTKYSQFIEGVSSVRTGLGFSETDDTEIELSDKTINYGKGLLFTKGEILNEEKKVAEETEKNDLDDTMDLLDAKLKFLCQQQTYPMSPIQEMMVQLQTLKAAWDAQSLTMAYLTKWACSACESLDRLEATAAPAGWRCHFLREAGQYAYTREADGHTQLAYPTTATAPAPGNDDMDISTTPPHSDGQEELQPPLPRSPVAPVSSWADPPPPGTEPPPPPPPRISLPPPPPPATNDTEPAKERLGDELLSFYKDIADLEKQSNEEVKSTPGSPSAHPPPPPPPSITPAVATVAATADAKVDIQPVETAAKGWKKKSKVKISASIGMKHKTVSSLVAKWQQVADEITSD